MGITVSGGSVWGKWLHRAAPRHAAVITFLALALSRCGAGSQPARKRRAKSGRSRIDDGTSQDKQTGLCASWEVAKKRSLFHLLRVNLGLSSRHGCHLHPGVGDSG